MILFPYAGETGGGSVHSSFLLIEELLKRDWPVVVVFHGGGYSRDLARTRGFPMIDLPALGATAEFDRSDSFRLGNLAAAPLCRRTIQHQKVGLVHVNDKRMLRTWCLPARMAGAALTTHWRSVYHRSWSIDLGLRLSRRVICVSAYSRNLLPAWIQPKSDVIYNPFRPLIDLAKRDASRTRIRAEAGIAQDAAVVGYFGALLERKRPHMLLRILERIRSTADGRPVHGVVCGETLMPRDDRFFEMIGSGSWTGRITVPGRVTNVGEWMSACDVMIAPAVDEPLARVGVEAQSIGLPAIVSSDGGLREVVRDGVSGLVVDPDDFEAWVAAVRRVLDNPGLAHTLIAGGLRSAREFTVERHADAVEALFNEVHGAPATRRDPA